MSRFFAMTITDNGAPWTAPDSAAYTVRFGAPGLPAGWYDTITEPGGGTHPAVVVDENTVTVEIAEQAVSTPGQNILCVLVTDAQGYQIASWPFVLSVQGVPGFDAPEATVYYNALTAQVAQTLANAQAAAGSASAAAASETAAANSAAAAAQSAQEAAASVTGVVSFNGRQGAVTPQAGDYTAEMVGALAENGTAASAEKLASPVNIGNASFDGSGPITLGEIGALASDGTAASSETLSPTALSSLDAIGKSGVFYYPSTASGNPVPGVDGVVFAIYYSLFGCMLAFPTNGGIYFRGGATSVSAWQKIAYE